MDKSPITLEGLCRIKKDLEHLIKNEREDLKIKIQEARELGDLKENAEYHAAKEAQALVEGKIANLQHIIATSQVVDMAKVKSDKILFGATVHLFNLETGEKVVYRIVGEAETDISKGDISYKSPLAKALMGREEGDVVTVAAPKGNIEYEIESFEFGF